METEFTMSRCDKRCVLALIFGLILGALYACITSHTTCPAVSTFEISLHDRRSDDTFPEPNGDGDATSAASHQRLAGGISVDGKIVASSFTEQDAGLDLKHHGADGELQSGVGQMELNGETGERISEKNFVNLKQSIRNFEQPEVNQTWVNIRQELLSHRRSEPGEGSITKVLLLAYMRGGSTFFMDLFNQHPNTSIAWYEALDSFYAWYFGSAFQTFPITYHYHRNLTRRYASDIERQRLSQYLDDILTMDIDNLPLHTLAHKGFRSKTTAFKSILRCSPWQNLTTLHRYGCYNQLKGVCTNTPNRINITMVDQKRCDRVIEAMRQINPVERLAIRDYSKDSELGIWEHEELRETRGKVEQIVGQSVGNLTAFIKYHHCVEKLEKPVRDCWNKERQRFSQTNLVAAKILRWSLLDTEYLIQERPDLYMIHFVRDPRAIAASRIIGKKNYYSFPGDNRTSTEAKNICIKMRNDIADKHILEAKYPGLFLTVRYEDYILRYRKTIADIFKFIGREVPMGIYKWFERATNSEGEDDERFHTIRSNGSARVDQWMTKLSYEETVLSNKYCQDILDLFNYNKV